MTTALRDAPAIEGARAGDVVRRWIGFELAGQGYAVPILSVQEVLSAADIEPVPGSPPGVLGVINLRGQIVTAFDLRVRLGLPASASNGGPLIVFDAASEIVAARVDRVADVRQIADAAIKPAPRAGAVPSAAVAGLVTRGGELVTLLNPAPLFA